MHQNYRTTDPEASRIASASVEPTRYWRVMKVAEAVQMYPNRTAAELAHLTGYFDAFEFNRRLSDAAKQVPPLVVMGRNRKCTVKGTSCHEWGIV
jgi:hypothetical protein